VEDSGCLDALFLHSFHATIYPFPESAAERERLKDELAKRLQETTTVHLLYLIIYLQPKINVLLSSNLRPPSACKEGLRFEVERSIIICWYWV